ncbi:hypothetical protein QR680_004745 [Steinernema hermaphroditum]|uniref:Palmitoyl-protein thioesterase 1 n=1 Tax=Steinernema hermaphroditum TaxID=289476 RepID=A0AA39HQS1_9BILA|nr:hypothetical protein QR680_004745 [Steinernema hermaphroditum]
MRSLGALLLVSLVAFASARSRFFYQLDLVEKNSPTPVVLWHGMGDNCCNPISMGSVKRLLEHTIDGVYVHSLMLGDGLIADTTNSFLDNMNSQVASACDQIAKDEKLRNGYNAIGFSQGGLFLRAVAQRCPNPPMKTLVSIGGPQQGINGFPYCPGPTTVCDTVRKLLDWGAYWGFVQDRVVQAQYWHDPNSIEDYKTKNIFLADINNANTFNETYKTNLQKLENFVMIKFLKDNMVVPKESEWFGFYADNDVSKLLPMEETELYQKDLIGIKQMNADGKLHFLTVDADHLEITHDFLVNEIIKKYFM